MPGLSCTPNLGPAHPEQPDLVQGTCDRHQPCYSWARLTAARKPKHNPSCSQKPQSKCWFSPCGSLAVSQSSGEEAAAGSAEPRHTPPLQHSPKDSHCPSLSPAILAAARTPPGSGEGRRRRHSQQHGLTSRPTRSRPTTTAGERNSGGRDCRNRRACCTRLWLQHQRKVSLSSRGREDIESPTGSGSRWEV